MVVVIDNKLRCKMKRLSVSGVDGTRKLFRDLCSKLYNENSDKPSEMIIDVLNDEFNKIVNFDKFVRKNTEWYIPTSIVEKGCYVFHAEVKKFEYDVFTKPKLYNYIISSNPSSLISDAKYYVKNSSRYKRSFVKLNEKLLKYLKDYDYYYYLTSDEKLSEYVDWVVKKVGNDIRMEYLDIARTEKSDEKLDIIREELVEIAEWFLHDNYLEKRKSTSAFRRMITKIKYLVR